MFNNLGNEGIAVQTFRVYENQTPGVVILGHKIKVKVHCGRHRCHLKGLGTRITEYKQLILLRSKVTGAVEVC